MTKRQKMCLNHYLVFKCISHVVIYHLPLTDMQSARRFLRSEAQQTRSQAIAISDHLDDGTYEKSTKSNNWSLRLCRVWRVDRTSNTAMQTTSDIDIANIERLIPSNTELKMPSTPRHKSCDVNWCTESQWDWDDVSALAILFDRNFANKKRIIGMNVVLGCCVMMRRVSNKDNCCFVTLMSSHTHTHTLMTYDTRSNWFDCSVWSARAH